MSERSALEIRQSLARFNASLDAMVGISLDASASAWCRDSVEGVDIASIRAARRIIRVLPDAPHPPRTARTPLDELSRADSNRAA
jgi:hypothetical protein